MSRSVENWTQHTCYWASEIWQKGWAVVYSQWSWCARYTTKKRYQQVCCYIFGKLPVHTSCNIKIQILLLLFCLKEGRLAEWSECWMCNSEALEVHARPDRYLDLFSVVPSANLWPRLSKNQLVCLLPVGILNHVMFHLNYLFHNTEYLKLEVRIKLGAGVLAYKSDGGARRKISKTSLNSTESCFMGVLQIYLQP